MKRLICLFIIALLSIGCAHNQGTVTKDEKAFIKFTGNYIGASFQVDESQPVLMDESNELFLYEIDPGTHIIKVFRNENLVIERKLYFGDNITQEINVK